MSRKSRQTAIATPENRANEPAAAQLAAVMSEAANITNQSTRKAALTLRDRMAMAPAPRKIEPSVKITEVKREPKTSAKPAFEMPALQFDADGAAMNYHMQASALARYAISHGKWPDVSPIAIHNAFAFGISKLPDAIARGLRLSRYSTWADVHARLKDILGRGLSASKIASALALPATTEDGRAVEWEAVLMAAGAKVAKPRGEKLIDVTR